MSDQVVNSSSLEFKETQIINFVLNNETQTYEAVNGSSITNTTRRMLVIRQLRFFRRIARAFRRLVAKVIRPVVNVIRKHGPLIGGIAGGLIGGVVGVLGGPGGVLAGAKAGFSLGTKVGIGAQAVVRACVPSDKLTIKCEKNAMINATAGAVFETAKMVVTDKVADAALAKCGAPCDKAIKAVTKLIG